MIKTISDLELSEEKIKTIAFWSVSDRKLFPQDMPKTRLGMMASGYRPEGVGPGAYNLEKQHFAHNIEVRPLSSKGYIVGARTAERWGVDFKDPTPDPGAYQNIDPKPAKQAKKPFNTAEKRFHTGRAISTPGVGSYNCDFKGCKRVQFQQSFGKNPVCLPSIKQLSSIKSNTDKLSSTTIEKRYNRRLAYLSLFY